MRFAALLCLLCVCLGCESSPPVAVVEPVATTPIVEPVVEISAVEAPTPTVIESPRSLECQCGPDCDCEDCCCEEPVSEAKPVEELVVIGAVWCRPCVELSPLIEATDGVRHLDIERAEDQAEIARLWGAQSPLHEYGDVFNGYFNGPGLLPAFVKVSDGEPVMRWTARADDRQPITKRRLELMRDWQPPIVVPEATTFDVRPFVLVHANNQRGSGGIVGRNGNTYVALTNAHVIRGEGSQRSYGSVLNDLRVEVDGQVHRAAYVADDPDPVRDMALVRFQSSQDLPVLQLAPTEPEVWTAAMSHGYPWTGGFVERPFTLANVFPSGAPATGFVSSAKFLSGESGAAVTDSVGNLVGLVYGNRDSEGVGRGADWAMLKTFLSRNQL